MPDPRAKEFVPSHEPQPPVLEQNLLSRLDPMMPNNSLPTPTTTTESALAEFPAQPLEASLCRYSLGCTNPMCVYSHPSASAVAQSRRSGNEPLVLKQDPCRFQKECTNAECPYSHISPAVTFIAAKADKSLEALHSGSSPVVACHFQMACKNPACTYAHFDPATGQAIAPPATAGTGGQDTASSSKLDQALPGEPKACRFGVHCTRKDCHFSHPPERQLHISDRLARFGDGEVEGEMEVIIPVA